MALIEIRVCNIVTLIIQWFLCMCVCVIAGSQAAADDSLACHFATVSLEPDAGKRGGEKSTSGVPPECDESQSDVHVSKLPCTVDAEVQCRPVMVDQHTAMTDCGTVSSECRRLLLQGSR